MTNKQAFTRLMENVVILGITTACMYSAVKLTNSFNRYNRVINQIPFRLIRKDISHLKDLGDIKLASSSYDA